MLISTSSLVIFHVCHCEQLRDLLLMMPAEKNVAAETFLVHLTINFTTRAFFSVFCANFMLLLRASSVVSGAARTPCAETHPRRASLSSLKGCASNLSPLARRGVCYYYMLLVQRLPSDSKLPSRFNALAATAFIFDKRPWLIKRNNENLIDVRMKWICVKLHAVSVLMERTSHLAVTAQLRDDFPGAWACNFVLVCAICCTAGNQVNWVSVKLNFCALPRGNSYRRDERLVTFQVDYCSQNLTENKSRGEIHSKMSYILSK